ncbi:MAG: sulfatase-like hydrolase/transferase [Bryobacterales bacterium]|nr:sulfatase-like hydrolase/transferase [Bryobacterales bacterium]
MLTRRAFVGGSVLPLAAESRKRPNILWISCEDMSPQLGCYGDPLAITPNLDKLASQGTRFRHAYSTIGVCAPSRSAIITGVYASSLGSHNMRSDAKPPSYVRCFPEYLRGAGYYCTNNSKTDYNFATPKEAWDESSAKAHWKNRPQAKPFFSVFNLTITHESRIPFRGADHLKQTRRLKANERRDPSKVRVPAYYPDTPEVRRDLANVHDLITQMDYEAGDLLKQVEQAGLLDDTIVFFWSDHGVGLPRAKRWLYDSSTHVPLIVRIPEKYRHRGQGSPNTWDERLVSLIDLGPTVLNLAGVTPPSHMQGQAFLGADLKAPRKYVFAARDRMDERYDMVRAASDGKFRYIRNFDAHQPYYQYMNTSEKNPTMREIRRVENPPEACKQFKASRKPAEELYETGKDPDEVRNLAELPEHQATLRKMRKELEQWMRDIRDLGLVPETEMLAMTKRYGSEALILQQRENRDMVPKLLAVVRAGEHQNVDGLGSALSDRQAAVRSRAALQLGALGKVPKNILTKMQGLMNDDSWSVRIRAAQALIRCGEPADLPLKTLMAGLSNEAEWTRLEAALALDEIGEVARPAIPALRKAIPDDPNKYVSRVANHTVNRLTGSNNEVS